MIFFNVGWMREYKGQANDTIENGGRFVNENGYGHEMCNFKEDIGRVYGYVECSELDLERLGGGPRDTSLDGLTVVWTATSPTAGGRRIVGWYEDATVFRESQDPGPNTSRNFNGEALWYIASAPALHARLLPVNERQLKLPYRRRGFMGQSNVWYADSPEARGFLQQVQSLIGGLQAEPVGVDPLLKRYLARQPDLEKRLRVEAIAIETVSTYFRTQGYEIRDRQEERVGYDLEATRAGETLKLEVKGSSLTGAAVQVTPNEYHKLRELDGSYRLCIVEDALATPALHIVRYDESSRGWRSMDGRIMTIDEVVGATAQLEPQ